MEYLPAKACSRWNIFQGVQSEYLLAGLNQGVQSVEYLPAGLNQGVQSVEYLPAKACSLWNIFLPDSAKACSQDLRKFSSFAFGELTNERLA